MRSAAFKRFGSLRRLHSDRSGHASIEHVRHHLYVGRDKRTRADALIKVTNKPGLVYEQNLVNEIATLERINQQLPESRYFPLLWDHGRLDDGRVFLIMSLFDEWPLATTIAPDPIPARLVANLRAAVEIASALGDLHGVGIFHVDLNPMNVLYRVEAGRPIIRIVDFESSYDVARHSTGAVYNPPTTHGFSAPELPDRAPDRRADVYSLGAVLYTMVRGYGWTWEGELSAVVAADGALDPELKSVLRAAVHSAREERYQSMSEMHDALAAYLESIWPGRSWR